MSQGDNRDAPVKSEGGESEIDRIIKEIEDLEKSIDDGEEKNEGTQSAADTIESEVALETSAPEAAAEPAPKKHLRAVPTSTSTASTPATEASSSASSSTASDASLGLKVDGCTAVTLDFSLSGTQVSLVCDGESLRITTESGAEFNIPLRKAA
ncbi:MAG: hypothetical protein AB7F43_12845 [Bacteriovoracia bacterium]